MAKKKHKSRFTPAQRLSHHAAAYGISIVAAMGLDEWNLYDAKAMADEFADRVADVPGEIGFAFDDAISPELKLAVLMQWSRDADPRWLSKQN